MRPAATPHIPSALWRFGSIPFYVIAEKLRGGELKTTIQEEFGLAEIAASMSKHFVQHVPTRP